jgi:hypothetical protein
MLTLADREEISRCLAAQMQQKDIGAVIGRSPSVVCAGRSPGMAGAGHTVRTALTPARESPGAARNAGRSMLTPCYGSG